MITGKDIEDLEAIREDETTAIGAEEANDIMTHSSNVVKDVLSGLLKRYSHDERDYIQTEVMLYANMSILDVGIKTLLFMTQGSRKHVEEVFNNLVTRNLEDPEIQEMIKKDDEDGK